MTDWRDQEERIRRVYAKRDASGKRALARAERPEMRVWRESHHRAARGLLSCVLPVREGDLDLAGLECLDVGCGSGTWIATLVEWGATPSKLRGVDLLEDRILAARAAVPQADFRLGSGWALDVDDRSMDLVCANTVFSSIIDGEARARLASEMLRVVRPAGAILVYDFRVSHPANPDTVGIPSREVARLFPEAAIRSRSLILAPPLARPLAHLSTTFVSALEAIAPFLRTHAMHLIRPRSA